MAMIFLEGFDTYPTGFLGSAQSGTIWQYSPSGTGGRSVSVITANPLTGRGCVEVSSSGSGGTSSIAIARAAIAPSTNEIYMGFSFYKFSSGQSTQSQIGIEGSTTTFNLVLNDTGQLTARRSTTVLASGPTLLQGVKYYIEVHLTSTDYEVLVDGVSVMSGTMTSIGDLVALYMRGAQNAGVFYVDDIYINDVSGSVNTGYLGELSVIELLPTSDGTFTDWTLSTGSDGWDILDDVPVTDSYIEAGTVGDISSFGVADLPVPALEIFAVSTEFRGQKSASGSSEVRMNIVNGASKTNGTVHALSEATDVSYQNIIELDPVTGLPWDPDSFSPSFELERTA
jgi:hypothetical protein